MEFVREDGTFDWQSASEALGGLEKAVEYARNLFEPYETEEEKEIERERENGSNIF